MTFTFYILVLYNIHKKTQNLNKRSKYIKKIRIKKPTLIWKKRIKINMRF